MNKEEFFKSCDIKFVEEQKEAITSDKVSVVAAGAGSGKTTVLSYRFLWYLMNNEGKSEKDAVHSDNIIALTFTKDAARNMKERIFSLLKDKEEKGLIKDETRRFKDAIISTTDSFCSLLFREDPIPYGFTSSFKIEEDDERDKYIEKETDKILKDFISKETLDDDKFKKKYGLCGYKEDYEEIIKYFSKDNFISLFKDIYTKYMSVDFFTTLDNIQKNEYLENIKRKARENVNKYYQEKLTSSAKRLVSLFENFNNNYAKYKDVYLNKIPEKYDESAKMIKDCMKENDYGSIVKFDSARISDKNVLDDLTKEKIKKDRDKINKATKNFLDVIHCFDGNAYKDYLDPLLDIVFVFIQDSVSHMRDNGILTYSLVMRFAIDILKKNKKVRDKYRNKCKRIMVDEFQDNNDDNRELVYLLATNDEYSGHRNVSVNDIIKNKVFMVGDEKQSIYRFRGADVSVFKKMISEDFTGEGEVLHLRKNFRSEKSLVDNINNIFEDKIMPSTGGEEYEANYDGMEGVVENVEPVIKFFYMQSEDGDDDYVIDEVAEAQKIALFIKNEVLSIDGRDKYKVYDKKEKKVREPKESDIAILIPKTSNQEAIETSLTKVGLSYRVKTNKALVNESVLGDFYSILQSAVYGKDDEISYSSFLISPYIGVKRKTLLSVLNNKRNKNNITSFIDSEDEKDKVEKAERIVNNVLKILKNGKLTEVLDYLWFDEEFRYYTIGTPLYEHYDYLYSILSSFDSSSESVVDFLDYVRSLMSNDNAKIDKDIQRENDEGILIETIHKSKGLEYPIVIVMHTGGEMSNKNGVFVKEAEDGVIVPPFLLKIKKTVGRGEKKELVDEKENEKEFKNIYNPSFFNENDNINLLEKAEEKRLLYTAATRAMNHLIFSGVQGSKDNATTILSFIKDGLGFECTNNDKDSTSSENNNKFVTHYGDLIVFNSILKKNYYDKENGMSIVKKEDRFRYTPPARAKDIQKIGVTSLINEEQKEGGEELPSLDVDALFVGDNEKSISKFGTLTHLILEKKINNPLFDPLLSEEILSFVENEENFSLELDRKIILKSAIELLDKFLNSSFYNEHISWEKETEKRFYTYLDGKVVEGVIDLILKKDNEMVVVDYKTDKVKTKEKHKEQLSYYINALKKKNLGKKTSSYVIYLRDPSSLELVYKDD